MKRIGALCLLFAILVLTLGVVPAGAVGYSDMFDAEYTQTVESAFTFAIVGDTQKVAYYAPEKMEIIYDWIVENVEEKNIKFVAGLGDITDKSEKYEWEASIAAIRKMDGIVPYSLIRGNHDDPLMYVKNVNYESYTNQIAGMYKNVLNTYSVVTVGTLNYLFLNLDYGPADDVLDWACEVVEAHPKHNVIITTHGYIKTEGEFITPENSLTSPSKSGGNDPQVVWDKLVSKYENIVMVVCGHVATPEVLQFEATGEKGNKIQHVLVDYQSVDNDEGACGIVNLFHFSEDGKTVQVEPYSTIRQTHFGPSKTFELNSMGGNANEEPINWTLYIVLGATVAVVVLVAVVFVVIRAKKVKKS